MVQIVRSTNIVIRHAAGGWRIEWETHPIGGQRLRHSREFTHSERSRKKCVRLAAALEANKGSE